MLIRRRYRVSLNFLEYPRVVIAFKRKVGLCRIFPFPRAGQMMFYDSFKNQYLQKLPPSHSLMCPESRRLLRPLLAH